LLVWVPGRSVSGSIKVTVLAAPTAGIYAERDTLAPGQRMTLWGSAGGLVSPYTFRWSRNGIGQENVISTEQSIQVTGDSLEFDIYLVTTAQGANSIPAKLTISPAGIPLVAEVGGPDVVRAGGSRTWEAVLPGGEPPTTFYQWTRTCTRPECVPDTIGTTRSVTFEPSGSFDLDLMVRAGARVATTRRHIRVQRVPNPVAAVPGPRSASNRPRLQLDQTMVRSGDALMFALEGPSGAQASLRLVDVAGREVAPLFEGRLSDGRESIGWRAANLPSGVYLAQAQIAGERFVRRVIIVR
jgi:hypothetical protein